LAYIGLKKLKIGEGGKKLFRMFFAIGLVTFAIGIMTGGFFGIEVSQLPPFLSFLQKLTLLNPTQQPMVFLLICLALGIIHILTGIALEVWDKLRRKEITSAILDHFSWIVLIVGLVLAVGPLVSGMFLAGAQPVATGEELSPTNITLAESIIRMWDTLPGYSKTGVVMFLSGALALFLFVGRKSKGLFIRFAKGGYELYGVVQVFADVLSYSRLLALGLATSVIAGVINTIAVMMGETPFIGPVLMVIILIVGHLGNILINCLSGFIHTARLQFVEFFGKFYEGGGKSFNPFQREGKYTDIVKS
jgi:V/A-type H+-transporting ATPase subunit I